MAARREDRFVDRFTDAWVKARRPAGEYVERSGLRVRVGPQRKAWICLYRRTDGVQRRLTLGAYPALSVSAARAAHAAARDAAAKGGDPAGEKVATREAEKQAETVDDLAADYLTRHAEVHKRASSAAEDRRILDKDVLPKWGTRKAASITRRDVIELLDGIADRGAGVMANRTAALLSRLFKHGIRRGIIDATPVVNIARPHREVARDRTLGDDEIRAFWNALAEADMAPLTRLALKFLLVTGARRSEVAGARMSEFDRDGKTWTIPAERSKNGIVNMVPLSQMALDLLVDIDAAAAAFEASKKKAERRRDATKRLCLFPSPLDRPGSITPASLSKALRNNLEAMGFSDGPTEGCPEPVGGTFVVHDLRRTVATSLQRLGVRLEVVEAVLGHVSGARSGIVAVYQRHDYADEKRAALDLWATRLQTIICGTPGGNVVPIRAAG